MIENLTRQLFPVVVLLAVIALILAISGVIFYLIKEAYEKVEWWIYIYNNRKKRNNTCTKQP